MIVDVDRAEAAAHQADAVVLHAAVGKAKGKGVTVDGVRTHTR